MTTAPKKTSRSRSKKSLKRICLLFAVEPIDMPRFQRRLRPPKEAPESGGYAVHAYYGQFSYDFDDLKSLQSILPPQCDITLKSGGEDFWDIVVINNG